MKISILLLVLVFCGGVALGKDAVKGAKPGIGSGGAYYNHRGDYVGEYADSDPNYVAGEDAYDEAYKGRDGLQEAQLGPAADVAYDEPPEAAPTNHHGHLHPGLGVIGHGYGGGVGGKDSFNEFILGYGYSYYRLPGQAYDLKAWTPVVKKPVVPVVKKVVSKPGITVGQAYKVGPIGHVHGYGAGLSHHHHYAPGFKDVGPIAHGPTYKEAAYSLVGRGHGNGGLHHHHAAVYKPVAVGHGPVIKEVGYKAVGHGHGHHHHVPAHKDVGEIVHGPAYKEAGYNGLVGHGHGHHHHAPAHKDVEAIVHGPAYKEAGYNGLVGHGYGNGGLHHNHAAVYKPVEAGQGPGFKEVGYKAVGLGHGYGLGAAYKDIGYNHVHAPAYKEIVHKPVAIGHAHHAPTYKPVVYKPIVPVEPVVPIHKPIVPLYKTPFLVTPSLSYGYSYKLVPTYAYGPTIVNDHGFHGHGVGATGLEHGGLEFADGLRYAHGHGHH